MMDGSRSAYAAPHGPDIAHGANLDASGATPREQRGDADRLFHIPRLDQIEAPQHLLRLAERPVRLLRAAIANTQGLGRFGALQHLGLDQMSLPPELVSVCEAFAHHGIRL